MGNNSRILAFGGTGRIGPAVVDHLARQAKVTLFTRNNALTMPLPHRVTVCNVRDPLSTAQGISQALNAGTRRSIGPLGVLYMATAGMDSKRGRPIDDEFAVAVGGLDTVVSSVASHMPTPRDVAVLFVSSLAVSTYPKGGLEYAVGKAAGEQYSLYMARNPPIKGWRFNVLRVGRVSRAPELKSAVARLAEFLLGDSSHGISGQVFAACSPASE